MSTDENYSEVKLKKKWIKSNLTDWINYTIKNILVRISLFSLNQCFENFAGIQLLFCRQIDFFVDFFDNFEKWVILPVILPIIAQNYR